MILRQRSRVQLKGTKISYDVIDDAARPVEAFYDGMPVGKLSAVDRELVILDLIEVMRRRSVTGDPSVSCDPKALNAASKEIDKAFRHVDAAFAELGEGYEPLKRFKRGRFFNPLRGRSGRRSGGGK